MNTEEAKQAFDGLMLGDAGLEYNRNSPNFYLGLSAGDPNQWRDTPWSGRDSKIPQMQYLVHIMVCLERLDVRFSAGYPRAQECYDKGGKPFLRCYVESHTSDFLAAQFKRWYRPVTDEARKTRWFADGRKWYKVLPPDAKLSPLTMAVWLEGDGYTSWSPYPWVILRLCTNNFTKEEVEDLSSLLLLHGIQARVCKHPTEKQMTWVLNIGAISSVNTFFDLTESHVHPCYQYKVKRPKHSPGVETRTQFNSLRRVLGRRQ